MLGWWVATPGARCARGFPVCYDVCSSGCGGRCTQPTLRRWDCGGWGLRAPSPPITEFERA